MSDWQVITGDCVEVLRTLPAGSVDAVVTDPPYGIGFKYNQHDDTPDGYGPWLWSVIDLAESKCLPGSPVFVWQAMKNVRKFAEWFPREWRLFAAAKNFVQMRPTAMQYAHDPVVCWWTEGEKYAVGTASRDWHVADTSPGTRAIDDDVGGHPCPRPLGQVRHMIEQWVRPGGLVLDCFAGSGTTGVACVQTGRKFIGIEIDPTYADIARRRIAEAANTLWTPKPTPEQQGEMFNTGGT